MTFGYSRDDVGKFLPIYLSKGILQSDPFEVYVYSFLNTAAPVCDARMEFEELSSAAGSSMALTLSGSWSERGRPAH